MRRFLIASAAIAALLVCLSANVIPVFCVNCDGLVFRTNVTTMMFGGYGEVMHQVCGDLPDDFLPTPSTGAVERREDFPSSAE